ncbi:uncharacterized protein simc1 isoform X1 [Misgurnus anguillicaudatus]|uniref:uncharacterized protein simc1 isoform X1 n=1 Tax=Misgurnus anguillicaudatus TaxID=75329 RepID=UPI003CCFB3DC
MDDIISLSSGSSDDGGGSDVVFISTYQEAKDDAVPFIREEWLPVTPVLIDITDQKLTPSIRKGSKRNSISPILIDLSEVCPSDEDSSLIDKHDKNSAVCPLTGSRRCESQTSDIDKDVVSPECFRSSSVRSDLSVSPPQENSLSEPIIQRTNSTLASEQSSWDKTSFEHFSDISSKNPKPFERLTEESKNSVTVSSVNTKDAQLSKPEAEQRKSPEIWDAGFYSPTYSLDSPYYCPSEVDAILFSDVSSNTSWKNQQSPQILASDTVSLKEDGQTTNNGENMDVDKTSITEIQASSPSTVPLLGLSLSCSPGLTYVKANSPTSTELLASDTMTHSPGRSIRSSPSSLNSFPISPCSSPFKASIDEGHEDVLDNMESDLSKDNPQNRQQICLAEYRKLMQCMVGTVSHMLADGEEDEDFGSPEPLCRQSLSLVNSTIEENYPEGTLQLLADFIQPRYFPPVDITKHLLRGIFLDPQSSEVLAIEAYNLLMKTQRYHPANTSTVPWDWQLLTSVMEEHDDSKRLRTEVRCLLLQYVLKVLEDDFQFRLTKQCLHLSLVKKMLSCEQRFTHVKDLINWMMNAAKESVNHKKETNNYLKMVLSLQRMLTLALEVDKNPESNSNKLSQELFLRLIPSRQIRLLLLSTIENKLLKSKLLERLMEDACSHRSTCFMSLSLLLHYFHNSTLASDPSDGDERWRSWSELLQLLWMLTLSYEEAVTGHLNLPITERFDRMRSPLWTRNDQVTRSAVREAIDVFLSRAVKDVGQNLPTEMRESLFQLQDHIIDFSSVIQIN